MPAGKPASEQVYRFLFYAEQNYCFEILRPLQALALREGHTVKWLLAGDKISHNFLHSHEQQLDIDAAVRWQADAVIVPGDRVPAFIPGLKVAVFHGLNEDKRGGDYPDRGMFDLYCTEGPGRSESLQRLAQERGADKARFSVRETGWIKLDGLFNFPAPTHAYDRPQILFASTFTPSLSCAELVFEQIQRLSVDPRWQWLITLHPKMDPAIVARYRALAGDNLEFFDNDKVVELLHRADVMVCDNSSILQEFLLLRKPVVTVNNRDPQPYLINISEAAELESAINSALDADAALSAAIANYGKDITPWLDGQSARRVLTVLTDILEQGWEDKKPRNLWRNLKMRKTLGYWGR